MNAQPEIWRPHVTVAAVVERDGRFLLVEEQTDEGPVFNQPAGHLEPGESLLNAAARETLEETAHHFTPDALLGVYHYRHPAGDTTYMRFAFTGEITGHDPERMLDAGIIRAVWMCAGEMNANAKRMRTPLVMRCIKDYQSQRRYPLELITYYG